MEKRICPNCNKPAYSAVIEQDWTCPHCGATIPKEKGPQELELQTDRNQKIPSEIIPQTRGHIPFTFEEFSVERDQFPRDRFIGTVRDFRRYLGAMRRYLDAKIIGNSKERGR